MLAIMAVVGVFGAAVYGRKLGAVVAIPASPSQSIPEEALPSATPIVPLITEGPKLSSCDVLKERILELTEEAQSCSVDTDCVRDDRCFGSHYINKGADVIDLLDTLINQYESDCDDCESVSPPFPDLGCEAGMCVVVDVPAS